MTRPKLRASLILAIGFLAAGLVLASTPAHAITYDLTSDHCTGGCGTAPFGTVTLTQNGTTVDVTVDLAAGYSFAKTGAADDQAFKFNATGVVLGDITVNQNAPAPKILVADAGAFNGDSTGNFGFGIICPNCGPGGSDTFSTDIIFHVANATIADLTAGNNLGIIFVADVLAPNGNTGPVDVTGPPVTVAEPGTLLLLGSGLAGIGAWSRRRVPGRA